MHNDRLRNILSQIANNELSIDDAIQRLRNLPFEQLSEAKIDHHRELRQGTPEIIFGQNKTPKQIVAIAQSLLKADSNVLCTRTKYEAYSTLKTEAPDAVYDEVAHTISIIRHPPDMIGKVGVLCAGTSDMPVAREAAIACEFFGAQVVQINDIGVAGLHRLLASLETINTCQLLIVIAGMEGALPSVVGGICAQPIIAVPTSVGYGASLGGLTPLLAMLNSCASGVTVVNIDNGFGAAAAAHRILTVGRHEKL
ncbi:MAG: nickel pincer cofactor biosynthesis protein LarB [Deltaproteobacteria bacterium]|nr:nickel pincer cofactor biosynthesis protein LarB [Deltaproteobacteria bacterium]